MHEFYRALDFVADTTIMICFLSALAFVVSYMGFFAWWKTRAGRALLFLFLSWVAVTTISLLTRLIGPDYWGREWLRVFGWGLVAYSLINLLVTLWRNFRHGDSPLALEPRHHTSEIPVQVED